MSDKDKPAFVDIGHRSQRLQREAANAHGLTVGGPVGEWVAGCMKAAADSMLKASHEAPADVIQGEARATQADFDLAQSFADTWCDGSKSAAIALVGKLAKHRLAYQSEAPAQGEGIGESGPLPRESAGKEILIRAKICYPGSAVSDILIGGSLPVQISNEALRSALAKPVLPLADREAIAREGPAPITSDSLHCFGCVHLKTEDWREPSGDGETFDSGTSARCGKVPTEHGGQSISAYWNRQRSVPKWCPCLSLPPSPVGEGI